MKIQENYEIKGFKELASEIVKCKKCFTKRKMEKLFLFFDGSLSSSLMVIGQNPIYPLPKSRSRPFNLVDENDEFQYSYSVRLRKLFKEAGIDYKDCYVTNIVKDSVEDNKVDPEMVSLCSPFLEREIELFKGRVVLIFGTYACKYFKLKHGESTKRGTKYFFASYHPAYIFRIGGELEESFKIILDNVKMFIETAKKSKEYTLKDFLEEN